MTEGSRMPRAHDFTATTIEGDDRSLGDYAGQVMLLVNVASKCGFTPQYEGLEKLYREHSDGLVVLGFPCDQFGNQEPGDEEDIKQFCSLTYNVSFPMFAKIEVNGDGAHPLYSWLRSERSAAADGDIEWNFTKFLVGKDGRTIKRYGPSTEPAQILPDIEKALAT
jgi:glutathione peroxidase